MIDELVRNWEYVRPVSKYAHYQMEIEKDISSITTALTHISKGIDELKEKERKSE